MISPAEQDVVFQAISHRTRRAILNLLQKAPKGVTEIASHFTVSQPAISQQLRVLLKASLVTADTVGRERIYRANPGRLRPVHDWVSRAIADPAGHVWAFKAKHQLEKGK